MFKLSPRLQLIYTHLLSGEPVWDFCCDHGYLGLNAYESGDFPSVHFVDQVPHIIRQLEERFQQNHFDEQSPTRAYFWPRAAEDLSEPLRGTVVIAGVGAFTVLTILKSLVQRGSLQAERLLLCPQGGEEKLLESLLEIPGFHYKMGPKDYEVEERGRRRKLLILHKI